MFIESDNANASAIRNNGLTELSHQFNEKQWVCRAIRIALRNRIAQFGLFTV